MSDLDEWYAKERQRVLDVCLAERAKVLAGECPKCAGQLTKTPDERQAGLANVDPSVKGVWHRVTCACGYWADWVLPTSSPLEDALTQALHRGR